MMLGWSLVAFAGGVGEPRIEAVAIGDFDGDGAKDLAVTRLDRNGDPEITVTFAADAAALGTVPPRDPVGPSLTAADVDGDLVDELAVAYADDDVYLLDARILTGGIDGARITDTTVTLTATRAGVSAWGTAWYGGILVLCEITCAVWVEVLTPCTVDGSFALCTYKECAVAVVECGPMA